METNKTLPELMGEIYAKEFNHIFEKEQVVDGYFNQNDFDTVEDRIRAAAAIANDRAVKAGAYAGALHRMDKHGDDRTAELMTLKASVSTENKAIIEAASFWMG